MEQTELQVELSEAKKELDEATTKMHEAIHAHGKKLERWLVLQELETREAVRALNLQTA